MFAIPGAFAFYRDLEQGISGPDVRQLQLGLTSAGLRVTTDGVFGESTEAAVAALYGRSGYSVPRGEGPSSGDETLQSPSNDEVASVPAPPSTPTAPSVIRLPRAELTVMSTSSAHVVSVPEVGSPILDSTLAVVEHGPMAAVAGVPAEVGSAIREGMKGSLSIGGGRRPVTVTAVIPNKGEAETSTRIELAGSTGELSESESGHEALLELEVEVVDRDSLLVPTVAVISGGSGSARVQKQTRQGSFVSIPVTEIGQLDGRSAVTATGREKLAPGDHVKVG
ncbi:peptidoglycan-binding domain-containing protein [Frondihabitans sucicola]|uniref:peptidoglycan-binding domain-containing protein n=1 Tax=Frondihabitans sucicola TaxID=1268041 RepID=UPI0025722DBB|nr:peptidoglycan-binding domain-containing protein [Frondihabitans sucicola]